MCHFCNFLYLLRTRRDMCKLIAEKALQGNELKSSNSSRGAEIRKRFFWCFFSLP